MTVKYFYGIENAALAFQRLEDDADWDNAVLSTNASVDWNSNPSSASDARVLDVANKSAVILALNPSDESATYSFDLVGAINKSEVENVFFKLDGGDYSGESGNKLVAINTKGYSYIAVNVTSVSSGTMTALFAPINYETTE